MLILFKGNSRNDRKNFSYQRFMHHTYQRRQSIFQKTFKMQIKNWIFSKFLYFQQDDKNGYRSRKCDKICTPLEQNTHTYIRERALFYFEGNIVSIPKTIFLYHTSRFIMAHKQIKCQSNTAYHSYMFRLLQQAIITLNKQ